MAPDGRLAAREQAGLADHEVVRVGIAGSGRLRPRTRHSSCIQQLETGGGRGSNAADFKRAWCQSRPRQDDPVKTRRTDPAMQSVRRRRSRRRPLRRPWARRSICSRVVPKPSWLGAHATFRVGHPQLGRDATPSDRPAIGTTSARPTSKQGPSALSQLAIRYAPGHGFGLAPIRLPAAIVSS